MLQAPPGLPNIRASAAPILGASGARLACMLFPYLFVGVASATLHVVIAGEAHSEPLKRALARAYRNTPVLEAARAQLRAVDEDVMRARSGWAPQISARADAGVVETDTSGIGRQRSYPKSVGVQFTQPLLTGGRTFFAVHAAEASVRAERQNLRLVEGQTLLAAVTAYFDVYRDRQLLKIAKENYRVLSTELRATIARTRAGELTRTDVAQARARRARSASDVERQRSLLEASIASYVRFMGRKPGRLRQIPLRSLKVPKGLRVAWSIGRAEHPSVVQALYNEQAARHTVDQERGELMPRLDLTGSYTRATGDGAVGGGERTTTGEVIGRLSVPIYQGGGVRARIRQAKHQHVQRLQLIEVARRAVRAEISSAWGDLAAARAQRMSDREEVRAARIALKGVRAEESIGQRTILNVLDAELELFEARSTQARNQRDLAIAHFRVLESIGRLNAEYLHLPVDRYLPEAHYHDARKKWFATTIVESPRRRQTWKTTTRSERPSSQPRRHSYGWRHVRVRRGVR